MLNNTVFTVIRTALAILTLVGPVSAEPIKCVSAGKTIYTDDPRRCTTGVVKPIGGNIIISSFPKEVSPKQAAHALTSSPPSVFSGIQLPGGITTEDVAAGWQTIMDARKRGSWQAPEIPDYAK